MLTCWVIGSKGLVAGPADQSQQTYPGRRVGAPEAQRLPDQVLVELHQGTGVQSRCVNDLWLIPYALNILCWGS